MGWINAHIQAQISDTAEMVWTEDPAILSEHGPKPTLIPLTEVTTTGAPDVFVLRPLNSAEYIRIMDMVGRGMGATATVQAAYTGTVEIRPAGAPPIVIAANIRETLDNHCPPQLVAEIGAWIVKSSRKGVDDLPFRPGGAQTSAGDPSGAVRSDLRGLSERAQV